MLSREFLLSRGSCCGNGCANCPYSPRWQKGALPPPSFTGKKDIYGRWIYVGDIVGLHLAPNDHIEGNPKHRESLGEYKVIWEPTKGAFMLEVIKKNWFDGTFRTEEDMKRQTVDWENCPGIIITKNYLFNYGFLEILTPPQEDV
jgi:hypothetical protein